MTKSRRMLVVDDEETVLFGVKDYFERHGYHVHTAPDAATAASLIDAHTYAVVLLDLSLGAGHETRGLDLARRTRSRQPDAVIALVTAYSTPAIARDAQAHGTIVLEKPLPLRAIETAVACILPRAGGPGR